MSYFSRKRLMGSRNCRVVRVLIPIHASWVRFHMWVDIVVGSRACSKGVSLVFLPQQKRAFHQDRGPALKPSKPDDVTAPKYFNSFIYLFVCLFIVICSLLQLFDTLVSFFPEHMTQPKGNLVDLITF